MCQTQSISRYSHASRHVSKPSENRNSLPKAVPRSWPLKTLLEARPIDAEKTLENEYGAQIKQENNSDLIFNESIEMNSDDEFTEQSYGIKDYRSQQENESDDLLPSPQSKPTPESVKSFEPNFNLREDREFDKTLGKRGRSKDGQDDRNENTFQLLRDADAEEFIEILFSSNDSAGSANFEPSLSDASLCSFDQKSILSDDKNESPNSAENFTPSAVPCDREQNFDESCPEKPVQEADLQEIRNTPKSNLDINSELKLQKPRSGLADASRRFVTYCKMRSSFKSITEVATEISIDKKRLYDIANIFQELDIILKYEDAFYFYSNDKIIPLSVIQQRISVFERKGSVTSLPCTALLIIQHFVIGEQRGYTADELVDGVYLFYSQYPKCESQKKNTIKRRVYDSLNILQGVDLITKESVNHGIYRFHLVLERA